MNKSMLDQRIAYILGDELDTLSLLMRPATDDELAERGDGKYDATLDMFGTVRGSAREATEAEIRNAYDRLVELDVRGYPVPALSGSLSLYLTRFADFCEYTGECVDQ